MEVEQKHITTIRLHDAKGSNVYLAREGHDYQLRMVSEETVVNIVLGPQDLRKLCQQILQLDIQENGKPRYMPTPENNSFYVAPNPRTLQDSMSEWVASANRETMERASFWR